MGDNVKSFYSDSFYPTLFGFLTNLQEKCEKISFEKIDSIEELDALYTSFYKLLIEHFDDNFLSYLLPDNHFFIWDTDTRKIYHNKASEYYYRKEVFERESTENKTNSVWTKSENTQLNQKIALNISNKFNLYILFSWNGGEPEEGTKQSKVKIFQQVISGIFSTLKARIEAHKKLHYRRILPPELIFTQLNKVGFTNIRSYRDNSFELCDSKQNTLSLESINLFVGPNNAGKSTLIKIIDFLRNTQIHKNKSGLFAQNSSYSNLDLQNIEKEFSIFLCYKNTINPVVGDENTINTYLKLIFTTNDHQIYLQELHCKESNNEVHIRRIKDKTQDNTTNIKYESLNGKKNILLPSNKNLFYLFQYISVYYGLPHIFPDFANSVHVLKAHANSAERIYQITKGHLSIDGSNIADEIIRNDIEELEQTISEWLQRFGFVSNDNSFTISSYHEQGEVRNTENASVVSFKIDNGIDKVNLADMGSGIAHIIPIIVAGFIGNRDGTLILENPEHHLHHQAQAMLADLLIAVAKKYKMQKRILVETQSTYLQNELRRQSIKQKNSNTQLTDNEFDFEKHLNVYYCNRNQKGETQVYPLDIITNRCKTNNDKIHDVDQYINFEANQNIAMNNLQYLVNHHEVINTANAQPWYPRNFFSENMSQEQLISQMRLSRLVPSNWKDELKKSFDIHDKDIIHCEYKQQTKPFKVTLYLTRNSKTDIVKGLLQSFEALFDDELRMNFECYFEKISSFVQYKSDTVNEYGKNLYQVAFYTEEPLNQQEPTNQDNEQNTTQA